MLTSIFLAKLFGVVFVIGGLGALVRKNEMKEVVHDYSRNLPLMYAVGCVELIMGLLVVLLHNVWGQLHQFIISLFGWLMVLEGAFYLLMPNKMIARWVKKWNIDSWYITGGIVAVVIGLYLIYIGFLA